MTGRRPARPDDVEEICGGLPETWFGTSWGDVPTWLVPLRVKGDKGRGFVLYRKPHKTAVDPETGEQYDDLLVIRTANADDKQALVDGGRAVLHHRPLQRLQRRARPAGHGSARSPVTSWPR